MIALSVFGENRISGFESTSRDQIKLKEHSTVTSFNCDGTILMRIVNQDIFVASKCGKN